jgi:hypothetical protein
MSQEQSIPQATSETKPAPAQAAKPPQDDMLSEDQLDQLNGGNGTPAPAPKPRTGTVTF